MDPSGRAQKVHNDAYIQSNGHASENGTKRQKVEP